MSFLSEHERKITLGVAAIAGFATCSYIWSLLKFVPIFLISSLIAGAGVAFIAALIMRGIFMAIDHAVNQEIKKRISDDRERAFRKLLNSKEKSEVLFQSPALSPLLEAFTVFVDIGLAVLIIIFGLCILVIPLTSESNPTTRKWIYSVFNTYPAILLLLALILLVVITAFVLQRRKNDELPGQFKLYRNKIMLIPENAILPFESIDRIDYTKIGIGDEGSSYRIRIAFQGKERQYNLGFDGGINALTPTLASYFDLLLSNLGFIEIGRSSGVSLLWKKTISFTYKKK